MSTFLTLTRKLAGASVVSFSAVSLSTTSILDFLRLTFSKAIAISWGGIAPVESPGARSALHTAFSCSTVPFTLTSGMNPSVFTFA